MNRTNRVAMLVILATLSLTARAQEFETPPLLNARDLVAPDLLEGPHHRVDDEVRNDGVMNHFLIRSDYGELEAPSEEMLEIRVREIHALTRLAEISRSEVFADALKSSAMAPVDAVKNVVTDPVGTVKGIPAGLGRAFRGLYYKGRKTVHKAGEKIEERRGKSKQAEDDQTITEDSDEGLTTKEVAEKSEKAAKSFFGYDSALRELARKLQVDPYTSNQILRRELDRLAGAAFTAGLSFQVVMPSISVVSRAEDISDLVYSTAPSELERRNNKALKEMGVEKAVRLDFFEVSAFTPSLDTALIDGLEQMGSTSDREIVVEFALGIESEIEARYLVRVTRILADYHRNTAPLARLLLAGNEEVGRLIAGVTTAGKLVVPAAVDYLTWFEGMERRGRLYDFAERELRLSGQVSPRAERELVQRGWRIETRVLERPGPGDEPQ